MKIKKICILGGTGFVGRSLANSLSDLGYKIRILTRNRDVNKNDLILLPNLELVETNIHDYEHLTTHLKDCDAVINLVGILNESGTNGKIFRQVHVTLTQNIINACEQLGIKRLLQMSALNAEPDAPSHYLCTKGEAENIAHSSDTVKTTSFRPSVIFGPGDKFFNRFALLLKCIPLIFPLACAKSKFAPVFVGDLTKAMILTLNDSDYYGKRLDICGSKHYTLQELVEYTCKCINSRHTVIPLTDLLSRIQASLFDMAGIFFRLAKLEKPFSGDNYLSLKSDSTSEHNSLEKLNITPTTIEEVVPQYLTYINHKSHYDRYRKSSHRNG
jgi:nucleoside-diphosphate-sugar epimerase